MPHRQVDQRQLLILNVASPNHEAYINTSPLSLAGGGTEVRQGSIVHPGLASKMLPLEGWEKRLRHSGLGQVVSVAARGWGCGRDIAKIRAAA